MADQSPHGWSLVDLIGPNPSTPSMASGYWQKVPEWSLGGNDKYGDCTFVSLCNLVDLVTAVNGNPELVGEGEAEYFYSRETGFTPLNVATDQGAVLADVIRYWTDHGWPADPVNKTLGWCAIADDQIHQAVHSLGAVPAWCLLPPDGNGDWDFSDQSMLRQVPGTGSHAILIVESNPTGLKIVTWAEVVDVSHDWWAAYGQGQFAVRHPEWKVP